MKKMAVDLDGNIYSCAANLQQLIDQKDTSGILQNFIQIDVLKSLQKKLLPGSASVKHAAFILKSITSYFVQTNLDSVKLEDECSALIFYHQGLEAFKEFWSNFFDLYDIFEEKQSHIIEPFLAKLKNNDKFLRAEAAGWFRVLVLKLLHHDNRVLAKAGLTCYLDAWLDTKHVVSPDDKEFVVSEILPVLKDRVGWILPDARELHADAFKIAVFFSSFQDQGPCRSILLQYIIDLETSMSPVATYFLVLAGCSELEMKVTRKLEQEDSQDPDWIVQATVKTFSYIMSYRLNAMDKFLKVKIQQVFIRTTVQLVCGSVKSLSSLDAEILLTFMGSLSPEVCANAADALKDLVKFFDDRLLSNLIADSEEQKLRGLHPLNSLGQSANSVISNLDAQVSNFVREGKLEGLRGHLAGLTDTFQVFSSDKVITSTVQSFSIVVTQLLDLSDDISEAELVQLVGPLSSSSVYNCNHHCVKDMQPELITFLNANVKGPINVAMMAVMCLCKNSLVELLVEQPKYKLKFRQLVEGICCSYRIRNEDKARSNELTSEYQRQRITVLLGILKRPEVVAQADLDSSSMLATMKDFILESLESCTAASLPAAIGCVKILVEISSRPDDSTLQDVVSQMNQMWICVMDSHKTEYFVDACNALCALIASPCFGGNGILVEYADMMFDLCESMPGLVYLLTENLSRLDLSLISNDPKYQDYVNGLFEVNLKASCFGSAIPKSSKLTFMIWEHLCDTEIDQLNYEMKLSLPFNGSTKSRLAAILNIIKLLRYQKIHQGQPLLKILVDKLLDMNSEDSVDKRRYFSGSFVHRYKQRVAQFLLLLQPVMDLNTSRKVMEDLVTSLGKDGPQASVRYLTEWIIIRILLKFPELHESFFKLSQEYILLRPGFGCLFATICMHTAKDLDGNDQVTEAFYESSLKIFTGLLMGQNFAVRIYGNICLCVVYEHALKNNQSRILERYQVIYESAREAVQTAPGNFKKIYQQIFNDFYLKKFSPGGHFSLEVIFHSLPKLAGMVPDEIIHLKDLETLIQDKLDLLAEHGILKASPEVLQLYRSSSEATWHLKANLIDGREHGLEEAESEVLVPESQESPVQFQVKVKPWKYLPMAEELSDFTELVQQKKMKNEDGLVVVASLIDRIPNLGGLCRTCEIFGASKYIISSLKILDDPQFKSMSVSAHRWVDIVEVPTYELKTLLTSYAAKGYTVVAAEQALDSSNLKSFQFPQKTVLLLGNEKYGVPTDLLNLVQKCIEIPQVGLIRSLNVHVTGALFIWQYASQHVF